MGQFQIIAHRGASGLAPENTLAAIQKAVDLGAHKVEVDVHQTLDGFPVVIHDSTLERTTDGIGSIEALSYDEVKKLDAGSWFAPEFSGERVPLLSEVMDIVNGKTGLVIELKNGSQIYSKIEQNIWNLVKEYEIEKNTVISSMRVTVLNLYKKIAPEARLA